MPLSPVGQHLDGKLLHRESQSEVLDVASLSSRLDNSLEVLKRMLKQPDGSAATGAASVKQFLEKNRTQGRSSVCWTYHRSLSGQPEHRSLY